MIAGKAVLVSALERNRFNESDDIGGPRQCTRLFSDSILAVIHAAHAIRKAFPGVYDMTPHESVLEAFQAKLDIHEAFHVLPVIEDR